MTARMIYNEPTAVTGRIKDACARYNIGETAMRRLAKEAGACIKVGRSFLISYPKVDAYLESKMQ